MAKVSEVVAQHAGDKMYHMAANLGAVAAEISAKKVCTVQHLEALKRYEQKLADCRDTLEKAHHAAELGV